jgi:hypothetical protein
MHRKIKSEAIPGILLLNPSSKLALLLEVVWI